MKVEVKVVSIQREAGEIYLVAAGLPELNQRFNHYKVHFSFIEAEEWSHLLGVELSSMADPKSYMEESGLWSGPSMWRIL